VKGIILAGGTGSRLGPVTQATCKQLLQVYDKPMIYYPFSVLQLAGIHDILLITTPDDRAAYERLFGDGGALGMRISYAVQDRPRGIADAFRLGAGHIGDEPVALILGDNIFHGPRFPTILADAIKNLDGCTLFGYPVADPERYGVGEADKTGRLVALEEKPERPRSNRAITGLYLYDADVVSIAARQRPSARGELEITDVNRAYLDRGRATLVDLGRGYAWLDTGTPDALAEAAKYVQIIENRQGVRIACIEEIALRMGFIDAAACHRLGAAMAGSDYGRYVMQIAEAAAAPASA
jgi:glucose-1-phosphate thymidylyltransferase